MILNIRIKSDSQLKRETNKQQNKKLLIKASLINNSAIFNTISSIVLTIHE